MRGFERLAERCRAAGAELVADDANPDRCRLGRGRPAPRRRGLSPCPSVSPDKAWPASWRRLTGAGGGKLRRGGDQPRRCVNWLVNIRGTDLANTPINLLFALYHRENGLILLGDGSGSRR